MTTRSVTATYLARNLSDLLNQVRYQQITLEVIRGNDLVASVCPPATSKGYPIDQLDLLVAGLPRLSANESRQFLDDIHAGVASQPAETSAWAS